MPQHSYDADPYFKIIVPGTVGRRGDDYKNYMTIACVQAFDEYDYAEEDWLRDDEGVVSFDSEIDAQEYLAAHVDEKWIRPDDRLVKNHINQYRP